MPTRRLLLARFRARPVAGLLSGVLISRGGRWSRSAASVPAERARVLAAAALGGTPAVLLAFGADTAAGQRDLLAVAAGGVLVALEPLIWRGRRVRGSPRGPRSCRTDSDSGCNASAPSRAAKATTARTGPTMAWNNGAPMRDAPARPVLAGTWQAVLSEQRAGMRAMLGVRLHGVPAALHRRCLPGRRRCSGRPPRTNAMAFDGCWPPRTKWVKGTPLPASTGLERPGASC